MSSAQQAATSPKTPAADRHLVNVKVQYNNNIRRFRIAPSLFRSATFPGYLKSLLEIPAEAPVTISRYSTHHHGFTPLDSKHAYESLRNSIFVKGKARLTVVDGVQPPPASSSELPETSTDTTAVTAVSEETAAANVAPSLEDLTASVFATLQTDESKNMIRSIVQAEIEQVTEQLKQSVLSEKQTPSSAAPETVWRAVQPSEAKYTVRCDICHLSVEDVTFYHCNICREGDFDICAKCVKSGYHCLNDEHFLESCKVVNGKSVSVKDAEPGQSSTSVRGETRNFGRDSDSRHPHSFPGQTPYPVETNVPHGRPHHHGAHGYGQGPRHGLHSFGQGTFGHHGPGPRGPGFHGFSRAGGCPFKNAQRSENNGDSLSSVRHLACCDGCNCTITGARYKCVDCPDFDYCATCFQSSEKTHKGHSFVTISHPSMYHKATNRSLSMHFGVLCDGPGCISSKRCIVGVRYKCSICDNFDLCENCEALPDSHHDITHPMIKLKTPVRRLSVAAYKDEEPTLSRESAKNDASSVSEDRVNVPVTEEPMSEKPAQSKETEASEVAVTEPATVRAELEKPVAIESSIDLIDLSAEVAKTAEEAKPLSAMFVGEAVNDGTVVRPGQLFFQSWSLKNSGLVAWPAGVTAVFVSGDKMFPEFTSSVNSSITPYPVQPGETAVFAAMLQAPNATGSHTSYWKLMTAENERFGENLWCDIVVEEAPENLNAKAEDLTGSKYSDASDILFPVLTVDGSVASSVVAHADDETVSVVTTAAAETAESSVADDGASTGQIESASSAGDFTEDDYELVDDSEGSVW